jgi:cytochrome c oxidase assembly protein subunit 15
MVAGPSNEARSAPATRAVEAWLWVVAALVLVMASIGGATRLTGSGLSITEWELVGGVVPPLGEAAWSDAFAKYRQIPQYTQINKGMTLAEFKAIYWWEWGHRFLGRLLGAAFALPLAWFWVRGRLPRGLAVKLLGLLVLGALQGRIGWFMVQSGLQERVNVSPYRLALHLSLAAVLLGLLVWLALGLRDQPRPTRPDPLFRRHRWGATLLPALVLAQIVLGAFVAGMKAGLTYNTWPLMDGRLIPNGLGTLSPWYVNPVENVTTVQFNHRMMAYALVAVAVAHAVSLVRAIDDERVVRSGLLVAIAALAQAALGVWTLLAVVPIHLALAHQALAVVLLGLAVWHLHEVRRMQAAVS